MGNPWPTLLKALREMMYSLLGFRPRIVNCRMSGSTVAFSTSGIFIPHPIWIYIFIKNNFKKLRFVIMTIIFGYWRITFIKISFKKAFHSVAHAIVFYEHFYMILIKSKYRKHAKISENGYLYTFQRESITGYSNFLCDQREKNNGCHCSVNYWPGQKHVYWRESYVARVIVEKVIVPNFLFL